MKKTSRCRAHTNIALIKYWGKRNDDLFLPVNSSLSLTLDAFYTDTSVTLDTALTEDEFYLNGIKQTPEETNKITAFLDLFRASSPHPLFAKVESYNHVPTAAGLASSASAFAALAGAMNDASGTHFPHDVLSTYARRGSGSATRSIYGGFVEWNKGTGNSSDSSYAMEIDKADWDIGMIIIAVNTGKKKLSSRIGMKQTMETSPFYSIWAETAALDLAHIKEAIEQQNFIRLGEITEANGMRMHATMLGATPPISYWEPDSVKALQKVREIRDTGIPCYVTMDAGPNVKVLCRQSQMKEITQLLTESFDPQQVIPSTVGSGIHLLDDSEWHY